MNKNRLYLAVLLSIVATSTMIPACAEVNSLQTGSSFYKGGSVIQFSGTTLSTDPPNVTVLIFDPNDKFLLLASGTTDSNHAFQVSVDTSLPNYKQLFSLKGMYNATAFISNQASGKTVSFAFSPDGSSLMPSPPTNLTATSPSSTEVDLKWLAPQNSGGLPITGYNIERNDGNGFNVIAHSQTTTYNDMGLAPNSEHAYRVSAINQAGSSIPSNSAPIFTLPSTTPSTSSVQNTSPSSQNSNQSLSDILQQRYAAAKKLQEILNTQTPGTSQPSSPTPSTTLPTTPQNSKQAIQLSENIGVSDMAANPESKKSNIAPENNLLSNSSTNFDIRNIIYPAISLVGVGIVVVVLYIRKKRKTPSDIKMKEETAPHVEPTPEGKDSDYALAILKNRLAKGEITLDEFKILKDELSEP